VSRRTFRSSKSPIGSAPAGSLTKEHNLNVCPGWPCIRPEQHRDYQGL